MLITLISAIIGISAPTNAPTPKREEPVIRQQMLATEQSFYNLSDKKKKRKW